MYDGEDVDLLYVLSPYDWSTFKLMQPCLNIETNRTQVEAEYQEVLQNREEIRQYWEEHNRDRFARIAAMPHKPGQEVLWAKLEEQKARRTAKKQ